MGTGGKPGITFRGEVKSVDLETKTITIVAQPEDIGYLQVGEHYVFQAIPAPKE